MSKWCDICHRNEFTDEWKSCDSSCPVFGKNFEELARIVMDYEYSKDFGYKCIDDDDEFLVDRETDNNGCPINCPDKENYPNCYCQPDTLED